MEKKMKKIRELYLANKLGKRDISQRTLVQIAACSFLIGIAMAPHIAMAAPWDSVGQQILGIFTSGLARTIAIVAVVACGIAALCGKLSWDWVIKIAVGITLIFGAAQIVDMISSAAGTISG
jgi:type IV secretory pathway VirB2 component (pilin)